MISDHCSFHTRVSAVFKYQTKREKRAFLCGMPTQSSSSTKKSARLGHIHHVSTQIAAQTSTHICFSSQKSPFVQLQGTGSAMIRFVAAVLWTETLATPGFRGKDKAQEMLPKLNKAIVIFGYTCCPLSDAQFTDFSIL